MNDLCFQNQSESRLLEIGCSIGEHISGDLAFGLDAYLYISIGDGGGPGDGDQEGNAQKRIHCWENELLYKLPAFITSFGQDEAGEIYLVDMTGKIYKLVESDKLKYTGGNC